MRLPDPTVRIFFGLEYSSGLYFTLDDPVRGVLDNATYLLATDDGSGVDVETDAYTISIRRGRSRELDEFQAGTCTVSLWNFDRTYDALNAASIYYGDLVPGKRIQIIVNGSIIYAGVIEDWNLEWGVDGTATATLTAVDALGQLAMKEFDEWTTTGGQLAGARIQDLLNRAEVSFGSNISLSTGQSTLQADLVTWGSNVLNYAQLVAQSDAGRLYASRENVLTFRDRYSMVGAEIVATFADDASLDVGTGDDLDVGDGSGDVLAVLAGIPFHGIRTEVGSELLFNRVGVDRETGTLQTVEDVASEAAYGVRNLSLSGLLMDSDSQSLSMAEYLLYIYKDPTPRIAEIAVKVSDDINLSAAQSATVTALEIGDLVRVLWTPQGVGAQIDQTLVVEGVNHDIGVDEHIVTLEVAPSTQTGVFILDDPVWGVLDTGPGVLSF